MLLHNKQVYHMGKRTIELDVNTYLTIDPKVQPSRFAHALGVLNVIV